MISGRYFDGISSRVRPAQFSLDRGRLHIAGEDFSRDVAPSELSFAVSRGSAPARVTIVGGAVCEIPNSAEARALLEALGARMQLPERLETHRSAVTYLVLVFVALMAATWQWGIPLASDLIVDRVPAAWEARLGESVVRKLDDGGFFRPSDLPAARQAQIRSQFSRLNKPDGYPYYAIEFRSFGVPNAFALPGGTIVVADELVALSQSDDSALMAVLGHELGHLHYRHGLRAIVRTTLFSAWAAWYFGDVSTFVASAGAGFTALHYSREAEQAADRYALDILHRNALSAHGAAMLFQRLADWQPGPPADADAPAAGRMEPPEYLSTHPDIHDRIRLFETDGGAAPPVAGRR